MADIRRVDVRVVSKINVSIARVGLQGAAGPDTSEQIALAREQALLALEYSADAAASADEAQSSAAIAVEATAGIGISVQEAADSASLAAGYRVAAAAASTLAQSASDAAQASAVTAVEASDIALEAEAASPYISDEPPPDDLPFTREWVRPSTKKRYTKISTVGGTGFTWVETTAAFYVLSETMVAAQQSVVALEASAVQASAISVDGASTSLSAAAASASSATASATSAAQASASEIAATAARVLAETAANDSDAAYTFVQGTAVPLGDATVPVNSTFAVMAQDGKTYTVYRKDPPVGGTGPAIATEMYRSYTKLGWDDSIDPAYDNTTYLMGIRDSANRLIAGWLMDGTLLTKLGLVVDVANGLSLTRGSDLRYHLSIGTTEGELPLGGHTVSSTFDNPAYVYAIVDSAGRKLLAIRADGTVEGKFSIAAPPVALTLGVPNGLSLTEPTPGQLQLSLGTAQGILPIGPSSADGSYDSRDYIFGIVDSDGRKVLMILPDGTVVGKISSPEVVDARATQPSLAARLSHGLTPYGDPIGPFANRWSVRDFRMRLRKLEYGEVTRAVHTLIGDSYTQNASRFTELYARTLQTKYGFGGIGWVGFGWAGAPQTGAIWSTSSQPPLLDGSVRTDLCTVTVVGAWDSVYNGGATNTPSISQITSSTPGDYVRYTVPANHDSIRLFYTGDGSGVVNLSWDNGVTYGPDVPLPAVGPASIVLPMPAPSAAPYSARIRVASGNVTLAGVSVVISTAAGVVVNKLGGSGSRTLQWAQVTPATWAAQFALLGSHCVSIMHGTNDQGSNTPTDVFTNNLQTIFNNIALAHPQVDRIVVMPPENNRITMSIPMTAYAAAARAWAVARDIGFIDMQYFFGPPDNFGAWYKSTNPYTPYFNADNTHPEPATGGRILADGHIHFITEY